MHSSALVPRPVRTDQLECRTAGTSLIRATGPWITRALAHQLLPLRPLALTTTPTRLRCLNDVCEVQTVLWLRTDVTTVRGGLVPPRLAIRPYRPVRTFAVVDVDNLVRVRDPGTLPTTVLRRHTPCTSLTARPPWTTTTTRFVEPLMASDTRPDRTEEPVLIRVGHVVLPENCIGSPISIVGGIGRTPAMCERSRGANPWWVFTLRAKVSMAPTPSLSSC
jgi:hypothetical protein